MSQIRVDVLIHQLVGLLGKGTGGWRQTGALQSSGSDGLERLVRSGGQLDLDLIAGVDDAASREQLRRHLEGRRGESDSSLLLQPEDVGSAPA